MGPRTALLGWENGDGFAHLQRLRLISEALQAEGYRTLLAVHDLKRAAQLLDPQRHTLVQCPVPPKSAWQYRSKSFQCMADILMAAGFCDPEALRAMQAGWQQLFSLGDVELVVSDFSPSLNVACQGRLPCFCIGDGFTLPRLNATAIADFSGSFSTHGTHRAQFVADKLKELLWQQGSTALHRLLYGDQAFCITYPVLDHQHAPELRATLGPLTTPGDPDLPSSSLGAEQILVYLSADDPTLRPILQGLALTGRPVLAFIRDCPAELRREAESERLQIASQPLNLAAELPRSACLVHHGGLGTTEQALWNGTPQLIAPRHVEQQLNGSAIHTHQCGLTLTSQTRQQPETVAAALQTLASDTNTRGAALALARELRNTTPQGSLSAVVEACLKR